MENKGKEFAEEHLHRAKCIDDGKWVYGFYVYDIYREKHYIFTGISNICGTKKQFEEWDKYEINPSTLCKFSGKFDISGEGVFQGDFIESHQGIKILNILMLVKYGTYEAYCPADKSYMENVGFYVEAVGYPQMPLGSLSDYAKVIGNIFDNSEMLEEK